MIKELDVTKLMADYNDASARIILLDYDGTLVPFDLHPKLTRPSTNAKTILQKLSADNKNQVVLISGRDKENLEAYWGDLNIVLVAEHGGFLRNPKGLWVKQHPYTDTNNWILKAASALHALAFQYEGSFVELKSFSVAWHYRAIADKVTEAEKNQIHAALRALPFQNDFLIYDSEYTLELRTRGIDKGTSIARWMGNQYYDFVMALGDSQTDEDLFKIFGNSAYTIKVGKSNNTAANYYLPSQREVLPFLQKLTEEQAEATKVLGFSLSNLK